MDSIVFLTVTAGVVTYVAGQLVLKLIIEPIHEMRKTIAMISHSLIERANVIANPGVLPDDVMGATSKELRNLSSQLHAHLYLIPKYKITAIFFRLPSDQKIREAGKSLIGLSNSLHRSDERVYESNARRVEHICDSLGIFLANEDRLPSD